jgi:hypothetical protein
MPHRIPSRDWQLLASLRQMAVVMGKVGGYIRVSSRKQRDASDSPASQRQRLADAGATIFFEDVVSGFKLEQRRDAVEFQAMCAAISAGKISRLIATRLDRYARRDSIVLELAELCDRYGVEFVSISSGTVDTTTASGWLSVKMQLVFAEHFSRQLSENVRTGYQGLHRQGITACPPSAIPWHLELTPGTRHVVREGAGWADARHAVEQVLAGQWGCMDVAQYIWPRHGVMRTATSVRQWLLMPALQGHFIRKGVEIRSCWPALVTADEQERIVQQLALRGRMSRGDHGRGQVRALSGLCRCGRCGRTMKMAKLGDRMYVRCTGLKVECGVRMARALPLERELHQLLGPHMDKLMARLMDGARVVEPPAEVTAWRRELRMREAIPAEYRQPADQQRISELQSLIQRALSGGGGMDAEQMAALQGRALDAVSWFERSESERNRDLRLVVSEVVVDGGTGCVQVVKWRSGGEIKMRSRSVAAGAQEGCAS